MGLEHCPELMVKFNKKPINVFIVSTDLGVLEVLIKDFIFPVGDYLTGESLLELFGLYA